MCKYKLLLIVLVMLSSLMNEIRRKIIRKRNAFFSFQKFIFFAKIYITLENRVVILTDLRDEKDET